MKKILNFLIAFSLPIFYLIYNIFLFLNDSRILFSYFIIPIFMIVLMLISSAILYARVEKMSNNLLWGLILLAISLYFAKIVYPFELFPFVLFAYTLVNAIYIKVFN